MRRFTVSMLFLLLALCLAPALVRAEESSPSVTVQGDAEVSVAPDRASVILGVDVEAEDASVAQKRASAAAASILAALNDLGISKPDIQTSTLTLTPVYRPAAGSRGDRERAGYRARNTVRVRIRDLDQVGPAIDAGLRAGANDLDGVRFDLADDTAARREALSQAVAQAAEKAAAIAGALHMRRGEILEAREGSVGVTPVFAQASMMRSEAAMATPVAPGQVTVSANVTLRYELVK